MTTVSHYGVHYANDGVAYLEQRRGGTNAEGRRSKSPFRVRPSVPGVSCNHLITLNVLAPAERQRDFISSFLNDELLKVLAPVPRTKAKVFCFSDESDSCSTLISVLSKMSSPIERISFRADEVTENWLSRELAATNVQPLIIRQCARRHSGLLFRLKKLSLDHPRTILLSGDGSLDLLEGAARIESNLLGFDQERLMLLPWENIGAVLLRTFMKREWNGDWIDCLPSAGDLPRPPRQNPNKALNLPKLIAKGEGQRLEFKSTFQYCLKTKQIERYVRDEVPQAIAAFMNSRGGTLLIGVADNGAVVGVEPDLSLTKGSWDELHRRIIETIVDALGNDNVHRCKITREPFDDKLVVSIAVERSRRAVFVGPHNAQRFYIRTGNTTRKIDGEEMVEYISGHFFGNAHS